MQKEIGRYGYWWIVSWMERQEYKREDRPEDKEVGMKQKKKTLHINPPLLYDLRSLIPFK